MPAGLKPNEEEWREPFDRLKERFPLAGDDRVAEALRQHQGHAGKAASYLRELLSATVKEQDPDDADHVSTLLSSPFMFKHSCREHFERFDFDGSGSLDLDEVTKLASALYSSFGLEPPSEGSVRAFFVAMDENGDGVLNETEFQAFFEKFLRLAYFDVTQLRQLVEAGEAMGSSRPTSKESSRHQAARQLRSSSQSSSRPPSSPGDVANASEEELAAQKAERRRRRKAREREGERGCTPSGRSSSTPVGHQRGSSSQGSRHQRSSTPAGLGKHSDEDRLGESPSCSRLRRSRHADDDWKAESFKASGSFTPLSSTGRFRKGVDYGAGSTKFVWPA